MPQDIDTWERFLQAYGSRFERFDYDLRVGKGRPTSQDESPEIQKMALDLSQKRIDAVGFTADAIMCIEITSYAGLKAIGQLITYPILYAETFSPTLPVLPLLVCTELSPDVLPALKAYKIPFYVV
jgi:hypothetical protein